MRVIRSLTAVAALTVAAMAVLPSSAATAAALSTAAAAAVSTAAAAAVSTAAAAAVSTAAAAAVSTAAAAAVSTAAAATPPQTYPAPASGVWTVTGHGNGHGHGLSQYGSYGRALAGQNMAQIVGFYYPGASLQGPQAAVASTAIRVLLGKAGDYTTILGNTGLTVTGDPAALPNAGVFELRLVPGTAGLAVQSLGFAPTATWQPVAGAQMLPSTATFSSANGPLTLVRGDGSRGLYRGTLTGIRNGAAVSTVNNLDLDDYVRGVAPNESPSSWPAAALQAQVVAARTYSLFELREHAGTGSSDVCDSSSCQVYGGASSERASTNAAVDATAGQVLTYDGAAIFAQFSSSNGGWTAAGGKPYLVAAPDPFDNASTDPWFNWTRTVPVAKLASYYGLSTVTDLRVLGRNGYGDWGGEVTSVAIDGTTNGVPATRTDDGYGIRSAMGLPLQWFTITNAQPATAPTPTLPGAAKLPAPTSPAVKVPAVKVPAVKVPAVKVPAVKVPASKLPASKLPAAPTNLTLLPGNGSVTATWTTPPANASAPVTRYVITVAGVARRAVPARVRSTSFTGLRNGAKFRVTVQAINSAGVGAASTLVALPSLQRPGSPSVPSAIGAATGNRTAEISWARPLQSGRLLGYSVTVLGRAPYLLPATASHLIIASLPNGVIQTVYVRAINSAGTGAGVAIGVRPMPRPAVPQRTVLRQVLQPPIQPLARPLVVPSVPVPAPVTSTLADLARLASTLGH